MMATAEARMIRLSIGLFLLLLRHFSCRGRHRDAPTPPLNKCANFVYLSDVHILPPPPPTPADLEEVDFSTVGVGAVSVIGLGIKKRFGRRRKKIWWVGDEYTWTLSR